jgi:hypothetical protein
MPPVNVAGTTPASVNSWIETDDSSYATTQPGELTLSDVARRLHIDVNGLKAANPQLSLSNALSPGTPVNLPQVCTLPDPAIGPDTASANSAASTNNSGFSGDPLTASAVKAQLSSKTTNAADSIQAKVTQRKDGLHFEFDRSLSQKEATDILFEGGKVPQDAKLTKGEGNTWVVDVARDEAGGVDLDALQNTVNHFNSHKETVSKTNTSSDLVFTFSRTPKPKTQSTGPRRLDLQNDFGFKITKTYELDQGKSPVSQVKSIGGEGFGYEVVFDKPMTKTEVMDKLFQKNGQGMGQVQLQAVPFEPSQTWEVHVIGFDAAVSFNRPIDRAFQDANVYAKPTVRPDIPQALKSQFENKTIPPTATKHPPDVYTWEQDGHIAYVQTDGKNYYNYQATRLSGDKSSDNTIRYFVMEKGMPPRQGWQAYIDRWDDLNRQVITAFAMTLAAAGSMPGRDPQAGEAAIAATRRPSMRGVTADVDTEASTVARDAAADSGAQARNATSHTAQEVTQNEAKPAVNSQTQNVTTTSEPATTTAPATPKPAASVHEQIQEVKKWIKDGKATGDVEGLEARLRSKDPNVRAGAQEEFQEVKQEIQAGKKPHIEEQDEHFRPREVREQRISDANKQELENSSWLKKKEPKPERRRKFMKWLEKNHKVGEEDVAATEKELSVGNKAAAEKSKAPQKISKPSDGHVHLIPGSPEAEAAYQAWLKEEG